MTNVTRAELADILQDVMFAIDHSDTTDLSRTIGRLLTVDSGETDVCIKCGVRIGAMPDGKCVYVTTCPSGKNP